MAEYADVAARVEGEVKRFSSPQEVIAFCQERGIKMVDLKFADLPGLLQHYTIPVTELTADAFSGGIGFDGSSIRGFQPINESDMLLIPDPTSAMLDVMLETPTLTMFCNIKDPITGEMYSRDPRYVAQKAEAFLRSTGIADVSYWGPELEFFVFDDVRFDQTTNSGYYFIDSVEGQWNSGRDEKPNLGYKPRYKEGYFPAPPADTLQEFRSQAVLKMMAMGIQVEAHHHEVATAGQCEIDMRFSTLAGTGDRVFLYKYILKNLARQVGKVVTFKPKPLFQDNGSGMHTHQSLWKDGQPLFYQAGTYGLISDMARHYIGGLLHHAPALMAICAPTTNSYRRLVPGYEAPVNLVYSARNRSAAIRIPMISPSPKAKRLEFRCPDPSSNPYLVFAACLMAGLDGVINKIEPPAPIDEDIYELSAEEAASIRTVPGSLAEALEALEADHEFLLRGDVFTEDLIHMWIDYKRYREVDPVRLRPHPYEFHLYFDI
ncbi:MAG: type I glutamate--ammonia ligase [Chloroflexi bacterium]|nr:type I glutamate--ammonia ligase [Chloroflexota bacterium]